MACHATWIAAAKSRQRNGLLYSCESSTQRCLGRVRPVSPASGEKFGRYNVVKKISHGGMGDVYLAMDPVLERRVALKLLSGTSHDDRVARKRLISEAKCAAAIDH